MPATVLPFPRKDPIVNLTLIKQALMVAAVIAGVVLLDNMTGRKLSTALAA